MARRRKLICLLLFAGIGLFFFFGSQRKKVPSDHELQSKNTVSSTKSNPDMCLKDIVCEVNSQVAQNIGLVSNSPPTLEVPPSATGRGKSDKLSWQQVATNPKYHKPWLTNVDCKVDTQSKRVYVPFDHIKSYFDIDGALRDGGGKFIWSHSYSKVHQALKDVEYDTYGQFLNFASLNVENRPRVKCVSAREGVPLSTQWDKNGYTYSTQIGQYALSHWSKYQQKKASTYNEDIVFEDGRVPELYSQDAVGGGGGADDRWSSGNVMRVTQDKCVHFDGEDSAVLDTGKPTMGNEDLLGWDLKTEDEVTVSLSVRFLGTGKNFILRYVPRDDVDLERQGSNVVVFGYGAVVENSWKRFTRSPTGDLAKGLGKKTYGKMSLGTSNKKILTLESVSFKGVGCVTNITLFRSKAGNLRLFFQASDWLLSNQDPSSGGWPVGVEFNEGSHKYPLASPIAPGWNSAMSAGHAMSVLARAYNATGDLKHLRAAARALDLFTKATTDGGVTATVIGGQHSWYQEYPTQPSAHILNGFMYSLIGIHDSWRSTEKLLPDSSAQARQLFMSGVESLVTLLPFYDTGSGSVYDLRHFTMPGSEPKIARWDYHALHVNQLYVLSTILKRLSREASTLNKPESISLKHKSQFLVSTGQRWEGYMYGKNAEHN